ncbi:hypothetical protein F7D09_2016 [Bifidobacterium leontopitheci]|uniref:Uncharacterized protein n=1 Tax=Bifidobacterium leontopitheci TaxID=2650774 RepID=A0A6I1GBK4_9BIFI|nr:hypothetical protein F7D09_2016 [Bifidobacterium leontopitheci]
MCSQNSIRTPTGVPAIPFGISPTRTRAPRNLAYYTRFLGSGLFEYMDTPWAYGCSMRRLFVCL